MDKTSFEVVLNTFETPGIKQFARNCIETIPPYFYKVAASSTGKYHPAYTLGDGGVFKHTCALVYLFNHFMGMECWNMKFNERERDLMRVACIMHDSRKSGDQESFEKNKYTKFEHPILAANVVREVSNLDEDGKELISTDERELIALAIESHMGQWNTNDRSDTVLPLPTSKYGIMLHTVDYFASRKDVEVHMTFPELATTTTCNESTDPIKSENVTDLFKNSQEKPEQEAFDPVFTFGKYNGMKLSEVIADPAGRHYVEWAKENFTAEPWKSYLANVNL